MDQLEFYTDLDSHPFTGKREVKFKARLSEKEWLKKHFDGTPNCDQVTGVTPGRVYDVIEVEGFGDVADFIIIDDNGEEKRLGYFFFEDQTGVRYYSTQRPPSIGTFPQPYGNKVLEVKVFDSREKAEAINRPAWGWIEYEKELSEKEAADYELVRE